MNSDARIRPGVRAWHDPISAMVRAECDHCGARWSWTEIEIARSHPLRPPEMMKALAHECQEVEGEQ